MRVRKETREIHDEATDGNLAASTLLAIGVGIAAAHDAPENNGTVNIQDGANS
jgi:hypothetical protein